MNDDRRKHKLVDERKRPPEQPFPPRDAMPVEQQLLTFCIRVNFFIFLTRDCFQNVNTVFGPGHHLQYRKRCRSQFGRGKC